MLLSILIKLRNIIPGIISQVNLRYLLEFFLNGLDNFEFIDIMVMVINTKIQNVINCSTYYIVLE